MSMMLAQEVIKSLRNIGGYVSLVALLTYISRNILYHKQFFTTPEFQRSLTGL